MAITRPTRWGEAPGAIDGEGQGVEDRLGPLQPLANEFVGRDAP